MAPTSIRIPPRLHERIETLATDERRTFSNMVIVLLEQALAVQDELQTEILKADAGEFVQVQTPTTLRALRADVERPFKGPDFK